MEIPINSQTTSGKILTQVDFSHLFAPTCDSGLFSQAETIVWMAERALGVLHLLEYFLENEGVTVHAQTSIYAITAEVENIKAVARAITSNGCE